MQSLTSAQLLPSDGKNSSGHGLVSSDINRPSRIGILHQLVIGGQNDLHYMEPGSPKDRVVNGCHVHYVELRDDLVGVRVKWE